MRRPGFVFIIIPIVIIILFLGLAIAFFAYFRIASFAKSSGGRSDTVLSGQTINCADVTQIPKEYFPWVKEGADRWLRGDQAKLVAVITLESKWKREAISPTGAVGLGQFIARTARSKQSFKGYKITTVPRADRVNKRVTEAEKEAFRQNYPTSGRFQPGPSILGTAELLSYALKRANNDFHKAYAEGYNGEKGDAKYRNADKVIAIYKQLKEGGGCKDVAAGATATPTSPVAP